MTLKLAALLRCESNIVVFCAHPMPVNCKMSECLPVRFRFPRHTTGIKVESKLTATAVRGHLKRKLVCTFFCQVLHAFFPHTSTHFFCCCSTVTLPHH